MLPHNDIDTNFGLETECQGEHLLININDGRVAVTRISQWQDFSEVYSCSQEFFEDMDALGVQALPYLLDQLAVTIYDGVKRKLADKASR